MTVDSSRIADFCVANHIRRLSLFGSVLHGNDTPDSDADFLIEFVPGHEVGFLGMSRLERELSRIVGRRVDLRTPAELSRYFREDVVRTAKVQYAAA